ATGNSELGKEPNKEPSKELSKSANEEMKDAVSLGISPAVDEMQVGEKRILTLAFKADIPINLSVLTLMYDPHVIRLKVANSESRLGPDGAALRVTPSPDVSGSLLVTVTGADNQPYKGAGGLLTLEVEALKTGASAIKIDPGAIQLLSADGRRLQANIIGANITVK
ncbi:MAG: hypothetical protein ACRD63_12035, partial [Pyrinomonadaceae bacterium]